MRMDALYLGIGLGAGMAGGLLLYRPLVARWRAHREARERRRQFEETSRQQALERIRDRRELYEDFRRSAARLVEELADGGGRWSTFYLVRDQLRLITAMADADVAMAARQVCFVCQVMLNEGFSDELSVRFNQALRRFDEVMQAELAERTAAISRGDCIEADTVPLEEPPDRRREDPGGATSSERPRYFNVLR